MPVPGEKGPRVETSRLALIASAQITPVPIALVGRADPAGDFLLAEKVREKARAKARKRGGPPGRLRLLSRHRSFRPCWNGSRLRIPRPLHHSTGVALAAQAPRSTSATRQGSPKNGSAAQECSKASASHSRRQLVQHEKELCGTHRLSLPGPRTPQRGCAEGEAPVWQVLWACSHSCRARPRQHPTVFPDAHARSSLTPDAPRMSSMRRTLPWVSGGVPGTSRWTRWEAKPQPTIVAP